MGWTMGQYEDADFYRLNEILSSKEPEQRVVDPSSLL